MHNLIALINLIKCKLSNCTLLTRQVDPLFYSLTVMDNMTADILDEIYWCILDWS